jgi:hypothetical protein
MVLPGIYSNSCCWRQIQQKHVLNHVFDNKILCMCNLKLGFICCWRGLQWWPCTCPCPSLCPCPFLWPRPCPHQVRVHVHIHIIFICIFVSCSCLYIFYIFFSLLYTRAKNLQNSFYGDTLCQTIRARRHKASSIVGKSWEYAEIGLMSLLQSWCPFDFTNKSCQHYNLSVRIFWAWFQAE